jgi:hypothetical protein
MGGGGEQTAGWDGRGRGGMGWELGQTRGGGDGRRDCTHRRDGMVGKGEMNGVVREGRL